jgi:hypothetical protein
MHPKWSGTQITSKNAKISTLDLYNFFLAGYFLTIFWETFNLYIMIIYPKFAPILRSQKKIDFLNELSPVRQLPGASTRARVEEIEKRKEC